MSITTLNQLVNHCLSRHPRDDLLSCKKDGSFRNTSTEEFARRVTFLGLGLVELEIRKGDTVAILSENRPEWAIADMAVMSIGGVTVPIYDSLPPGQILHIMRDAGVMTIIVSNTDQLDKIRIISEELPEGLSVILVDPDSTEEKGVLSLEDLYSRGESLHERDSALFEKLSGDVRPEDVATIIYTSGTTGSPKGAMLTHRNILSNVQAVLEMIPVDRNDTVLSFLPLSHVLERMAGYYAILTAGGAIAYAERIDTVADDMAVISPTFLIAVPRFFEKMYENIHDTAAGSSPLKRKIFEWAVRVGQRNDQMATHVREETYSEFLCRSVARKLVYSRLRKALGGKIRFFVSGGAPLPLEIARFFHAVELPIYEGYGLTETSPVVACNTPHAWRHGSVGKAVPGVEIRIESDGEITVRGPNVMSAYLGKEKETEEALKQGWFYTGDIGELDADGFLYIRDRKKDLIVTSGGKNVAPQPIETMLRRSPYIKEILLIGNKRKFISALIIPELSRIDPILDAGIVNREKKITIENPRIRDLMEKDIEERSRDLASHERIRRFVILGTEFKIAEGELTPTLKVRRRAIEEKYRDLIDGLYMEQAL